MKNKGFKIRIGVLFFVIGIPIIINELYKREGWYSTVWTGADVLAYYGTLLGAVATIVALIVTIRTTHKQVQSERMYQLELEKWHNLEKSIDNMLVEMHPLRYLGKLDTISRHFEVRQLDQWIDDLSIRFDEIMVHLSSEDQRKMEPLLDLIKETREEVVRAINMSRRYFDFCDSAKGRDDLEDKKQEEYDVMVHRFYVVHEDQYQKTLNKKRSVFDEIYSEIVKESR